MPLSLNLVTPPDVEPVSLTTAKAHLRVDYDNTAEDALITAFITAARQYAERVTHRAFFNQTWALNLDCFPIFPYWQGTIQASNPRTDWLARYGILRGQQILLPKPHLVSITSITYVDVMGTQQTLPSTAYVVDNTSEPARLVPAPGTTWPATQVYLPGCVQITYEAGSYGDGTEVNNCPQTVCMAILLLVAHWYEHREAASELPLKNIPLAVDALLDTVKFHYFGYENN
jgi:uncharacterized phiE125 gp8 family phage protein